MSKQTPTPAGQGAVRFTQTASDFPFYLRHLLCKITTLLPQFIPRRLETTAQNNQPENWPYMSRIREVWAPQLEAEMRNIRDLIDKYPYVAMVPHSLSRMPGLYIDNFLLGHRVSRSRRKTDRILQDIVRLPLPDHAV